MKKRYIKETQERSISNIEGNIQDVITWLEAIKKDGWEAIGLDWEKDLVLTRYRLETDKELAKRKKYLQKEKETAAKIKAQIEEQDRLLYEKLKKKFDK